MNVAQLKKNFPIFTHHKSLVYLDSTATALKPASVIDKITQYYTHYSANVARGLYTISEKATQEYEKTRTVVANFIKAGSPDEIIFTRSTTEAINLLASSLGTELIEEGDEIAVSIMEHHSNFVPWQQLAKHKKAQFTVIDITDEGYLKLPVNISKKTKILALTYVSNVLGTINPIVEIVKSVREINSEITVIVDAAQAAPHMSLNVQSLGCDFLAFSSHKMLGPTGVGVLWGKKDTLNNMKPYNYGGEMIDVVGVDDSTFQQSPHRFEAGTPHIDGVIGLSAAIEYLESVGMNAVRDHEISLTKYALGQLKKAFGGEITIIGPEDVEKKGGVLAFTLKGCHPHDIAQILNDEHICIRAGHHCAMPLHTRLGIGSSSRASFYIYNDEEDVEKMVDGLKNVKKILG